MSATRLVLSEIFSAHERLSLFGDGDSAPGTIDIVGVVGRPLAFSCQAMAPSTIFSQQIGHHF